jgi:hypothetical protein
VLCDRRLAHLVIRDLHSWITSTAWLDYAPWALARSATTSPTVPGQSVEQRGDPAFLGVHERDPLYAVYMLILVLGLPKSEALGLAWDEVETLTARSCQSAISYSA